MPEGSASNSTRMARVKSWEVAVLAAILAAALLLDARWHAENLRFPLEHGGRNIRSALDLHAGHLSFEQYPPLTAVVTAAAFALFGVSERVAVMSLAPFHLLALLGVWWTGRAMAGPAGGLLSALGAAGCAWTAVVDHGYFHESALTAMLAVAFAALVASRGLVRPAPTLVLGVALGLGMLAKWALAFFLAVPMAALAVRGALRSRVSLALTLAVAVAGAVSAVLLRGVAESGQVGGAWPVMMALWGLLALAAARLRHRDAEPGEWNPGAGLAVACSLGALLCGWWYVGAAPSLGVKLVDFAQRFPFDRALHTYLSTLADGWWLFPAWLAVGTVVGVARTESRLPTLLALAGVASAALWYAVSGVPPANRYLVPGMAMLAPVAFGWAGPWPRVAAPLGVLLAALSLVQAGGWRPGLPVHEAGGSFEGVWRGELARSLPVAAPPDPTPWPLDETMARLAPQPDEWIGYYRHPSAALEADAFLLAAALRGVRVEVAEVPWDQAPPPRFRALIVAGPGDFPWLSGWREVGSWSAGDLVTWKAYRKEPKKRPG